MILAMFDLIFSDIDFRIRDQLMIALRHAAQTKESAVLLGH